MSIPSGIVTCLPEADLEDLVGVIEVLIQEHLRVFAAPRAVLGTLRGLFGARAVFGTHSVIDADGVRAAHEAGAEFILADLADQAMAETARELNATLFAQALTPLEVRALLELGVSGALLWPADVVGHVMAAHLARVGLAQKVIPMGGVGAFAAGEWLKHGSPAACVDATLLGDALTGGDLGQLRDRCESFRRAMQNAVAHHGGLED